MSNRTLKVNLTVQAKIKSCHSSDKKLVYYAVSLVKSLVTQMDCQHIECSDVSRNLVISQINATCNL